MKDASVPKPAEANSSKDRLFSGQGRRWISSARGQSRSYGLVFSGGWTADRRKGFQLPGGSRISLLFNDVKPSEDGRLAFSTVFEPTRSEELHHKHFAPISGNCMGLMSKGARQLGELQRKMEGRIAAPRGC